MKFTDRIRQAKSMQDAILVLAEGIDAILEAQAAGPSSLDPRSSWGEWSASPQSAVSAPSPHPFDVIKVEVDPHELADARDMAHQLEIDFEQLSSRGLAPGQNADQFRIEVEGARNAMWRAQARVRSLEDPGAILNHAGEIPGERENWTTTEENGQTIVDLPRADDARRAARRKLAEAIDLPGFFPTILRSGPARDDLIKAYEVGGPIWLNAVGQFDGKAPIIMQMPLIVRKAMVEDVKMDSPRMAYDLARDIFKDGDADTLDVQASNIQSEVAHGGTPYQGKGDR